MELDHIVPRAEGGSDEIDNAIPVCFECHAEIHLYNPQHPRGRKYRPEELRAHRDQWLKLCETSAQFLASIPPTTDVGPVQALIDELEFNRAVVKEYERSGQLGSPMEAVQFDRCLTEGAISLMEEGAKTAIYQA